MTSTTTEAVDPLQFPECFHTQVKEINTLKSYINGQKPEVLSVFSQSSQDAFNDRVLVQEFVFPDFTIEQISNINNQELLDAFLLLYKKLEEATKAPGLVEKAYAYVKFHSHRETRNME